MTRSLFIPVASALTLGVAGVVGYALLYDPIIYPPEVGFSNATARTGAGGADGWKGLAASRGPGEGPSAERKDCVTKVEPVVGPVASGKGSSKLSSELSAAFPAGAETAEYQPAAEEGSSGEDAPRVPIPLAFRPLPATLATANPQLADAVRGLQQDFVDALGGASQNPNDPGYYDRWIAAQTSVDERYRLLIGNENYLVEQALVNNQ